MPAPQQSVGQHPRELCEVDVERGFRALYQAHFAAIFRLLRCLGVPQMEAEDAMQRVFEIAHDRFRRDEIEIDNPRAWLRGVAVRVASHQRRWRAVRRAKRWLLESGARERSAHQHTPEDDAERSELRDAVGTVLDAMTPKLREVLVLMDVEDCAPREVAEILRIPVNTARSRRRLAREQFARLWQAQAQEDVR